MEENRNDFIENPFLFDKAKDNRIKYYDADNIYVLRKKKYIKKSDPELNSLILENSLIEAGFAPDEIELGFIDSLNKYGITRVKNRKPKVIYISENKSFGSIRFYLVESFFLIVFNIFNFV